LILNAHFMKNKRNSVLYLKLIYKNMTSSYKEIIHVKNLGKRTKNN